MPPMGLTLEGLDSRLKLLEEDRVRALASVETMAVLTATNRQIMETLERIGKWIESVDTRVRANETAIPPDLDSRLRRLESAVPKTHLIEGLMVAGVMGILSLVGLSVWATVFGGRVAQ